MSHFTVLIIGDNIEDQLAKYDENIQTAPRTNGEVSDEEKDRFLKYYTKTGFEGTFEECYKEHGEDWNGNNWKKDSKGVWQEWTTYNPDSKWDWYQIGGRWSGFFKLKNGATGEMGEKSWANKDKVDKDNYVDSAYKGDIDIKGMRRVARGRAIKEWDAIASCFDGEMPKLEKTWKQIIDGQGDNFNRDSAKAKYDSQPAIIRLDEIKENGTKKQKEVVSGFWFSLDEYQCSKEEYVDRAGRSSISTYAMVVDGTWYEKGEMGWWGCSSNEMSQDEWDFKVAELIDETSDDTKFSLVDCHI